MTLCLIACACIAADGTAREATPRVDFDTDRLPALEPVQFVPKALPESVDTDSRPTAGVFTLPPIQAGMSLELAPSLEPVPTVLFGGIDTGSRAVAGVFTLPPIQAGMSLELAPSVEPVPTVLFGGVDTGSRAVAGMFPLPPIQAVPSFEFPRF